MKVSTSIEGNKSLVNSLKRIVKDYEEQYEENVKTSTIALHGEAIKLIREKSSGQRQTRYDQKRTVTASKPGDPPNTDTGTSIKSVGFEIDYRNLEGIVGSNLKYLKHLEYGTRNMDARPWLSPALKKVEKYIEKIFRRHPEPKKKRA